VGYRLIIQIAWRYLKSKKTTQAINIITWISVVGMAIGTAALMLILSVFNGFEHLLSGMLSTFNPDLKVSLVEGKFADKNEIDIVALSKIKGIDGISFTIEETSFFEYDGSQEVGLIKGVDSAFVKVTGLDSSIVDGKFIYNNKTTYGLIGSGMNSKLSVNSANEFAWITAYMPSKNNAGPIDKGFNSMQIYPSGVFSVGGDIDMQYVIVDFEAANQLLGLEKNFSAIEINFGVDIPAEDIQSNIAKVLGPKYRIKNKYQQDEAFLKIMNIEKWISYLIACLTLLIIAFNMVGSLWMLVLEKKKDIAILKSMGMTDDHVKNIFLMLGIMITFIGLIIGLILAWVLYLLQKSYGLISIPEGFMIDAYPIEWRFGDMFVVSCTVLCIGFFASLLPAYRAARIKRIAQTVNG
jgi:lipoprotein-releasing system permease protein